MPELTDRRALLQRLLALGVVAGSPRSLARDSSTADLAQAQAPPRAEASHPSDLHVAATERFWSSLPKQTWFEVPATRMDSLVPRLPQGFIDLGAEGFSAVTADWSGAAFDADSGRLWCSGGGHVGSNNNGVYEFALETLSWRIAMSPSLYTRSDLDTSRTAWNTTTKKWIAFSQGYAVDTDEWRDGKPTAVHTYGDIAWLPSIRRIYRSGLLSNWLIDPVSGLPERCGKTDWTPGTTAFYDAARRRLIRGGAFNYDYWQCRVFDEVARGQTMERPHLDLRPQSAFFWSGALSADVIGNKAFCYSGGSHRAWTIALDTWLQAEVVLDQPLAVPPYTGGTYCESLGALAMLRPDGNLATIDPQSGRCSTLTIEGHPPPATSSLRNGIYGRWRWYARRKCFVLIPSTSDNVRLIRI